MGWTRCAIKKQPQLPCNQVYLVNWLMFAHLNSYFLFCTHLNFLWSTQIQNHNRVLLIGIWIGWDECGIQSWNQTRLNRCTVLLHTNSPPCWTPSTINWSDIFIHLAPDGVQVELLPRRSQNVHKSLVRTEWSEPSIMVWWITLWSISLIVYCDLLSYK